MNTISFAGCHCPSFNINTKENVSGKETQLRNQFNNSSRISGIVLQDAEQDLCRKICHLRKRVELIENSMYEATADIVSLFVKELKGILNKENKKKTY